MGVTREFEEKGVVAYNYFMDDDYGVATNVWTLIWFLHFRYFPRLSWARLTLKPSKSKFFNTSINILGHKIERGGIEGERVGLRQSVDKVVKIQEFPVPEDEKELDQFLCMTLYLKRYIPGRAEHARIMKEAVQWRTIPSVVTRKGSRKKEVKEKVGWIWTEKQQKSFDYVKRSIVENACIGGDHGIQYHLACDAS